MDLIYNAINKLNSMPSSKLMKYMDENHQFNEERLEYLLSNILAALSNSETDLFEKLFITLLDNKLINKLHDKYYNISIMNKCHSKSIDVNSMLNAMIYMDGMGELYDRVNNSIFINAEEFVFCYSVAMSSGSLTEYFKQVKEKYKIEKSN